MKRRNPRFGCRKIAEQISNAFGIELNKDVVRRILIQHYKPIPGSDSPSWLTVIGHAKDSLWSVDLFRCDSILLKSYWVMVVMDVFTRRIIGFGVAAAPNTTRFHALVERLIGTVRRECLDRTLFWNHRAMRGRRFQNLGSEDRYR